MRGGLGISLREVIKDYGIVRRTRALDRLTLSIRAPETILLLGPNGAGKTTLIRLIAGLTTLSHGTIEWELERPDRIGFAPEIPRLPRYARVSDLLRIHQVDERQVERLIPGLDILQLREQRVEALSKGQRQRLSVALAVLSEAPVLLFDEPYEGLDPLVRPDVRHAIAAAAMERSSERITIVSSHRLEEVSSTYSRVLVIDRGRAIQDLSASQVVELFQSRCLRMESQTLAREFYASHQEPGVRLVLSPLASAGPFLLGPFSRVEERVDSFHPDLETLLQLWLRKDLLEAPSGEETV